MLGHHGHRLFTDPAPLSETILGSPNSACSSVSIFLNGCRLGTTILDKTVSLMEGTKISVINHELLRDMVTNNNVDDAHSVDQFIKSRVKQSGSSFFWAMRLMSPQKRNAIYSVYAFCREVDDITDGDAPEIQKRNELSNWRTEIESIYQAKPSTLLGQSLMPAVNSYKLVKQDFMDLLDGMEMDIGNSLQIPDLPELWIYCDRVACSVGRLSNSIFELDRETGNKLAKSLGTALQLTNILRDVHEDYTRGHIYLPNSLLIEHGMNSNEINIDIDHSAVSETCKVIAENTRDVFNQSASLLASCEPRQIRPARIMMTLYQRLFEKLCDRGWVDLKSKVSLSTREKIYLIAKSTYFV